MIIAATATTGASIDGWITAAETANSNNVGSERRVDRRPAFFVIVLCDPFFVIP